MRPMDISSKLFLLVLMSSLLISTVSASSLPESAGVDTLNYTHEYVNGTVTHGQIINEPLYTLQTQIIPFPLWLFLAILGIIFLSISILYPERGELITAILALGFTSVTYINAALIGFSDTETMTAGDLLIVQPVVTVFASEWMSYLFLLVFILAFVNFMLSIYNFFIKSAKPTPTSSGEPGRFQ